MAAGPGRSLGVVPLAASGVLSGTEEWRNVHHIITEPLSSCPQKHKEETSSTSGTDTSPQTEEKEMMKIIGIC